MVDFNKLRSKKPKSRVIEPLEIFRRLPKPPGINDLYARVFRRICGQN